MSTKLTLSLDQEAIAIAKKIAKKRNTSLSKMVEEYFYKLMNKKEAEKMELHPDITSMIGRFEIDDDRDYKTILGEVRMKKHLKE
ncbi:MAG: hypothetical protein DWP98_10945 [Bacteroidetes bacterium]|nr:MAG: hypothetical protein DWP98_10945 [Bacteroidota bacterium]MBL1144297.1 hypothetical protein [Bacteroidota bacterium]MCB0803330.1 hypothetical protein [Flavobacteriales bacterium]NOG57093.1 hypothetical protein [Bacteroidota bacterium]